MFLIKWSLVCLILSLPFLGSGQPPNTLTASDKLYGLSKFWQEVNYNFVYLNKIDRQAWDDEYKKLLVTIQTTGNDLEYYRVLQKFCALLKDGHTNVFMPQGKGFELMNTMFGNYRFFIENIGGKAIIVRTNLSRKDEVPPGSEVTEVNGLPAHTYMNQFVTPYISSSTDYVREDQGISKLLQGEEGTQFQIKIRKPNGAFAKLSLTHSRSAELEVFPPFDKERELLDFKWLDNGIASIALNSFEDPKIDGQFEKLLPELYKAKGLIIDLRNNGGGDTSIGVAILQYLTNDKLLYGSRNSSRMHIAAFKAWGKFTNPLDTVKHDFAKKSLLMFQDNYFYYFDYEPDTIRITEKRLIVPTALLIGHGTASSAEDFLIYADKQKHMTKIGVNTYGSTGQPFVFGLPGGGSARICTKKDTYPDGREFVGLGIKPDIEVTPTVEDYLAKKDPVMERAVVYLKGKIK